MAMITTNFLSILETNLRTIFTDRFEAYPDTYTKVFNVMESTKAKEIDNSLGGLGIIPEVGELEPITYEDFEMGYEKEYRHIKYALGYVVSQELVEDDQYKKIIKRPKALANSAGYTVDRKCVDIFNYGSTTTYATGGDGKALFATDHPLKGGGTYANKPSTDVALTVSSLQAAIVNMRLTPDDKGNILSHTPKILLVPTSLANKAVELLNSKLLADTGNNNINSIAELENIVPVVWHTLTDQKNWFLLGKDHLLNFYWRKKFEQEMEKDFDAGGIKHKITGRFSVGFSDWRDTYGSFPA